MFLRSVQTRISGNTVLRPDFGLFRAIRKLRENAQKKKYNLIHLLFLAILSASRCSRDHPQNEPIRSMRFSANAGFLEFRWGYPQTFVVLPVLASEPGALRLTGALTGSGALPDPFRNAHGRGQPFSRGKKDEHNRPPFPALSQQGRGGRVIRTAYSEIYEQPLGTHSCCFSLTGFDSQ